MSLLSAESVSAYAACLGVIVSLILYRRNLADTRLSNSATMVLSLVNDFDSLEMRRHRRALAESLLENPADLDLAKDVPALQFLEEIAYLTRRGVLDKGMVWNSFFWQLEMYYLRLTNPINHLQAGRDSAGIRTLYREIEWLYGVLCLVDAKEEESKHYRRASKDEIDDFLRDEATLVLHDEA